MKVAVLKLQNGSTDGMGGLRPEHLNDMPCVEVGVSDNLFSRLSTFSDLLLDGNAPDLVLHILYGVVHLSMSKTDCDWIGSSFRRLVSEIVCVRIADKISSRVQTHSIHC